MPSTEICYWCGSPATSREHVPPKSFFPKGPRTADLITVPSCAKHNESFSKLDERFRFYLQAATNSPIATSEFERRTFRGLKRPKSQGLLTDIAGTAQKAKLDGVNTVALRIKPNDQHLFFEKMLRALYFHHFGEPFPGTIQSACTHLVNPALDMRELIPVVISFESALLDGSETERSVFHYRYARVIEAKGIGFAVVAKFYEQITVFGFGTHLLET